MIASPQFVGAKAVVSALHALAYALSARRFGTAKPNRAARLPGFIAVLWHCCTSEIP
jgi:hypothetical protein